MEDTNVVAIDFGASSGRVILCNFHQNQLTLKEIHRFENTPIEHQGKLFWDFYQLCNEMVRGLQKVAKLTKIDSLAIDTWGVDYGLISSDGQLQQLPVHYRDGRTEGMLTKVAEKIDLPQLYRLTGNQLMEINTLFQLLSENQEDLMHSARLLFMPDLFNYYLTGQLKTEQTIASTSQLYNPITKDWAWEVIDTFHLPRSLFSSIVSPGQVLGVTKPEFEIGEIPVINVCSHDTASAVVSVPAEQEFFFISCGTWSLAGTELQRPILSTAAYQQQLTNESGYHQTTRFLKNITGLWILQEVRREFENQGKNYSYEAMELMARQSSAFVCLIDPDASIFMKPGKMIEKIQHFAQMTDQPIPETDGALIRCIYESLAFKYRVTLNEVRELVGHDFTGINLVGGGSKSKILCEMLASATNKPVEAGPAEATALGNAIVQLLASGKITSLQAARKIIKESDYIQSYPPSNPASWDAEYHRFIQLLSK